MKFNEAVLNSEFKWMVNGYLQVKNAVLAKCNFSGAVNDFNKNGNRNFTLVVTEEMAEELKAAGWNVWMGGKNSESPYYATDIAVNMTKKDGTEDDSVKIYLLSDWNGEKSMTRLKGNTVGEVDGIIYDGSAEKIDLEIYPWDYSKKYPKNDYKIKGYLKRLYITQSANGGLDAEYRQYQAPQTSVEEDDEDIPF